MRDPSRLATSSNGSTLPPRRWPIVSGRRLIELVIELVVIYLLWPSVVAVYSSFDRLLSLDPRWFVAMVMLEMASFACMWVLIAIPLRSTRWSLIGTTQVVGNAVGMVVPGGNVLGTATQIYLLARGGFDSARATTAAVAAGFINLATLFILPLLAVPAVLSGVAVNRGLARAAWLEVGVFLVLAAVLAIMLLADRPIRSVGRWVQSLWNLVARPSPPLAGLPERLSAERAQVSGALQARPARAIVASVCNWLFDYLVLLVALLAVGAHTNPAAVLLAYTAAISLAMVPVTPGGIGVVEAGLLAMLMLSGVSGPQAALATLAYRLVGWVGPVATGLPVYWWYRRHLPEADGWVA